MLLPIPLELRQILHELFDKRLAALPIEEKLDDHIENMSGDVLICTSCASTAGVMMGSGLPFALFSTVGRKKGKR